MKPSSPFILLFYLIVFPLFTRAESDCLTWNHFQEKWNRGELTSEYLSQTKLCTEGKKIPEMDFFQFLKQNRLNGSTQNTSDLAKLAIRHFPASELILREAVEIFLQYSDYPAACKALLIWLKAEPQKAPSIKVQMDRVIRTSQTEWDPVALLDSLLVHFPNPTTETFLVLEELCWNYGHPSGAFQSTLGLLAFQTPDWGFLEGRIRRLLNAEMFEEAGALLDNFPWSKSHSQPEFSKGLDLFFEIQDHLQNWKTIIGYYEGRKNLKLKAHHQLTIAKALLRDRHLPTELYKKHLAEAERILMQIDPKAIAEDSRFLSLKIEALLISGKLEKAKKEILKEKENPHRTVNSGVLHYWHALILLFNDQWPTADSLLVLASAYTDHPQARRSLELRQWAILDSSKAGLGNLLMGIEESPRLQTEKVASLKKVPTTSPLWPHARFELAYRYLEMGLRDSSTEVLSKLSQSSQEKWVIARATAEKNFWKEPVNDHQQSIEIYQELLLKYPQGVIAEFSRERIKNLKEKHLIP